MTATDSRPAGADGRPPVIDAIVEEHAEEAAFLWLQRRDAVTAPNQSREQFADLDERLEAHVDGLRVAGAEGWRVAEAALENEGPEEFFPASVLALEVTDDRLTDILNRARALPEVTAGLVSALGWVEPTHLAGRVRDWLGSRSPREQDLGLAACAVHRRDPGSTLNPFLRSESSAVRARALRTAGELGRIDLLPDLLRALKDAKREPRFRAAWAGVLLGDRGEAVEGLVGYALEPGEWQLRSLQLALQAVDVDRGHQILRQLSGLPSADRLRAIGSGFVGSTRYVPWLIEQMSDPVLARVAGEAFVNITGADFNLDQLETMPPDGFEDGPTDDPADEDVEVAEDVALPWPDIARVKAWWEKHAGRFDEARRYFLGAPLDVAACQAVLDAGFQRQRVAAALHLSLLQPGTPLFNTSAPAWRQR